MRPVNERVDGEQIRVWVQFVGKELLLTQSEYFPAGTSSSWRENDQDSVNQTQRSGRRPDNAEHALKA